MRNRFAVLTTLSGGDAVGREISRSSVVPGLRRHAPLDRRDQTAAV
jgi:hypothetical protein